VWRAWLKEIAVYFYGMAIDKLGSFNARPLAAIVMVPMVDNPT